jgi:ATP-dependent Lhr-like helicase
MEGLIENIVSWFEEKKWEPFPFQKNCWNTYLNGSSGLLMAPTGSGKTLALGAPILQSIDPKKKSLQALWVTPLRALSQEIFEALEKASVEMKLDIEVGLRNGDTSTKERTKQRKSLPSLLITTPESLQLLLASKGYETRFKHLRSIVIDEWHDLYASKRGALLELGLSRLKGINPKLQIWGISATLGDPLLALSVLKGSVIENEKVPDGWSIIQSNLTKEILIESLISEKADRFPWRGHLGLHLIDQIGPLLEKSKSILIFTNTRSQCEIWFQALLSHYPDLAGQMAMHHSSIEKNTRLWVENALRNESLKVVVCTSSLDLGVDFAPVETVIQVGGPKSIARLMQRAGRSGHQPGAQSKLYFLPTHAMEIIESAALKIAVREKQIEASIPYLNSYDLLIQYLTTLAVSDGFYPHQILPEVRNTFCFQTLSEDEWNWILRFITTGGDSLENYDEYQRVTIEEDGKYLVTKRSIAMRHRFQIGTIVSDATLSVHFISGGFIGTLEEWFVSQLQPGDHFTFAGRVLEFIRVREMKVQVRLSKSKSSKVPAWMGGRLSFSSEMSLYLETALTKLEKNSEELVKELKGLKAVFEAQKKESIIPDKHTFLVETFKTKEGYHHLFYTFEGRFINEALANLLAYRLSLLHPISCSLAYNDYGFELLSDQPIDIEEIETQELWSTRDLMIDLRASINLSELSRRSFRDIAVISGLVFNGYPGKPVKTKHLQSSSQLVYEVFKSYEPDNLLMLQAEREVFEHQLEFDRLKRVLENIKSKNTYIAVCEKPTPFSFPIITDRLRARLSNEDLEKRIQKMIQQL